MQKRRTNIVIGSGDTDMINNWKVTVVKASFFYVISEIKIILVIENVDKT